MWRCLGLLMIHYHGTPITPDHAAAVILAGRHGMVSFYRPEQVSLVAEVCQSFVLDNGAFSAWRKKKTINWNGYVDFVADWLGHPGYDWCLIPDVIDGTEQENDDLLHWWEAQGKVRRAAGVPIWHLHESLDRLATLVTEYPRIALGSSGQYATVGSPDWWARMTDAMDVACCIDGQPVTKLHGLRMMSTKVFPRLPLSSADSTNVARNLAGKERWKGTYVPPTKAAKGVIIAQRIESAQSAKGWAVSK